MNAKPSANDQETTRKRGRPIGWRMKTYADLTSLTIEDFSFIRAVIGGMKPVKAFTRFYANVHFDMRGEPIVPHGLEINKFARDLKERILTAATESGDPQAAIALRKLADASLDGDGVDDQTSVKEAGKVDAKPTPEQMERDSQNRFQEWFESLPEDMYSESELPERYREYLLEIGTIGDDVETKAAVVDQALNRDEQVKALNVLQTLLAERPTPKVPTSVWLARPLATALARLGIRDMGQFVAFISVNGRHWHRNVPGLGPKRALRLEKWLDSHARTLGEIDRDSAAWEITPPLESAIVPLRRAPGVLLLEFQPGNQFATPKQFQLVRRAGFVPFELLQVPPELDGRNGMFRANTPNLLGAQDDYEAVRLWLGTFESAGKLRTLEAYRREIERFYAWCLYEARVALSSVSLTNAVAYQSFLRNIPDRYITTMRVTRDDPEWRPWRGQLDARSQKYALNVISQCFNVLMKNSYVTGNPFFSLKSASASTRVMDTSRSLTDVDLQWVREALHDLPGLSSKVLVRAAIARRTRLILHLGLTTGMRLHEIATASLVGLRKARVDGVEQDDDWMLPVVGKGGKPRDVPIAGAVRRMILAHHEDAIALLQNADNVSERRIRDLRKHQPLICALMNPVRTGESKVGDSGGQDAEIGALVPVRHTGREIDDNAIMANDSGALGRVGLYKTLKAFFRGRARASLRQARKSLEASKKEWLQCKQKNNVALLPAAQFSVEHLTYQVAMWERRTTISTHWLRHTFAHEVLRLNDGDSGLKLAQQLLGHASISTTAEYVKQDESAKVRAARKVNPLG